MRMRRLARREQLGERVTVCTDSTAAVGRVVTDTLGPGEGLAIQIIDLPGAIHDRYICQMGPQSRAMRQLISTHDRPLWQSGDTGRAGSRASSP